MYIQNVSVIPFSTRLLTFVYKLILDITYVTLLYPLFSYSGFSLEIQPLPIVVGGLCALGTIFLLPGTVNAVSDFMLYGFAVVMVLPLTTYCSFGSGNMILTVASFLFYVVMIVCVKLTPTFEIPALPEKIARTVIFLVFILTVGYIVFTTVYYLGFSVLNISFDFTGVYETRAAYKATAVPLSGYLYPWAGNAIFPAAMAYYLHRKHYGLVAIAAFSSLMLFTVTGQKSMLFLIFLTLGSYLLISTKHKLLWFSAMMVAATVACVILYYAFDMIMPFSLFVRRMLILPAKITDEYHTVFSANPNLSLSHSILSGISSYPYTMEPSELIGALFYTEGETHANTGILGDAYMNFGYIGMFVWAVLFSFILKVADSLSFKKNVALCSACFAPYIIVLSNSALFTVLGTHGMTVSLLFLLLFPRQKDQSGSEAIIYG